MPGCGRDGGRSDVNVKDHYRKEKQSMENDQMRALQVPFAFYEHKVVGCNPQSCRCTLTVLQERREYPRKQPHTER